MHHRLSLEQLNHYLQSLDANTRGSFRSMKSKHKRAGLSEEDAALKAWDSIAKKLGLGVEPRLLAGETPKLVESQPAAEPVGLVPETRLAETAKPVAETLAETLAETEVKPRLLAGETPKLVESQPAAEPVGLVPETRLVETAKPVAETLAETAATELQPAQHQPATFHQPIAMAVGDEPRRGVVLRFPDVSKIKQSISDVASHLVSRPTTQQPAQQPAPQSPQPLRVVPSHHDQDKGIHFAPMPYWALGSIVTGYLTYSLAESLGGSPSDYVIALAFELTPMLALGARMPKRSQQQLANIMAGIMFVLGAILFMYPKLEKVLAEKEKYSSAKMSYQQEVERYDEKLKIDKALVEARQKAYLLSMSAYESAIKAKGENNWITIQAKASMERSLKEFDQAKKQEQIVRPELPVKSSDYTLAMVELFKRLSLYIAAATMIWIARSLKRA